MTHLWTMTTGRGALGPTTSRANLWGALAAALACMMAAPAQAGGDGDACEDCIEVGEGLFFGTTADNTNTPGNDSSCDGADTIDEWFCYTPSCSGLAWAGTCGPGTDFETTLAVFEACDGAELACNDSACGYAGTQVVWEATAGTTYFIRLSGDDGATGNYELLITCAPLEPGVSFFLDPDEFESAVAEAGMVLKGIEDFSEMNLPPGSVAAMDDPLDANTDNKYWDPGDIIDNLTFQSNLDVGGVNGPNPSIENGLALFTTGFIGATHNGVVSNTFVDSFDILSGIPNPDNHSAMSFNLVSLLGTDTVDVTVWDEKENLLGFATGVPAPVAGGGFLGIVALPGSVIGRVNIYDPTHGAEGVYEVAAYVSGPCPWDLDGTGSVGASDLLSLLASWGPCKGCPADFDGNGTVGASDLLTLLVNWGPCP